MIMEINVRNMSMLSKLSIIDNKTSNKAIPTPNVILLCHSGEDVECQFNLYCIPDMGSIANFIGLKTVKHK